MYTEEVFVLFCGAMDALHAKTLATFFSRHVRISYKRGEIILRSEDNPSGVMYLVQGFVRQYSIAPCGETFVAHIFKPGSFFPMTWLLNNTPNTYTFEAITEVDLWRAPGDATHEFLHQHPEIMFDFASRMLIGVSGLLERAQHLAMDNAHTKLVFLLLYYGKHFGIQTREGVVLQVPLTHKDISAWIATTRETASVHIERLKKKGIIRYHGRQLIILNLGHLEREVAR